MRISRGRPPHPNVSGGDRHPDSELASPVGYRSPDHSACTHIWGSTVQLVAGLDIKNKMKSKVENIIEEAAF